ncbi:L-2-amino-thiazoline-4-carboxylic acid hydrolase [Elioraea sp.]|uniref:L-2-amino-thiazoline-4-carboxylic acid hydrolase n=1 Tax=Elioraea sp. TaxID=2185103 RepID=UPI0025BED1D7|nr:L-2-amino-thiazoline-4-carboxylic acid hydrolase [Elioraea sp.]
MSDTTTSSVTTGADDIGILRQRAIEAAFAKELHAEMSAELGERKATEILARAVIRMARAAGAAWAEKAPGGQTSIQSFVDTLPAWTKDDALRIEVLKQTETEFAFNVTRCRYAETYKAMGIGHLGAALSCNRDGTFCEGYDPRLKLTRTQTIMGGAPHCDFRYSLEGSAGGGA